jgi:alpha/beta superfamily hydrolase
MTDVKVFGQDLLREWYLYKGARPKEHVLDIQHDKDDLERWAKQLQTNLLWEGDLNTIAECCHQFETRLERFKDKIVIELLTGGAA